MREALIVWGGWSGHEPEQLVVHRGARRAAEPPLRPQGVQQVFGAAHR